MLLLAWCYHHNQSNSNLNNIFNHLNFRVTTALGLTLQVLSLSEKSEAFVMAKTSSIIQPPLFCNSSANY